MVIATANSEEREAEKVYPHFSSLVESVRCVLILRAMLAQKHVSPSVLELLSLTEVVLSTT